MNIFIFVLFMWLNMIATFFFAGVYYPIIGIVISVCSIISCLFFAENKWMHCFVKAVIKTHNINILFQKGYANRLLVSIAFLACSMKIGILVALFVETGAVVVGMLLVLIVSGYLFEGRSSGMTISGAWNISKIIIKVYLFLTSWIDKIFELLIKLEYTVLNIEINDNWKSE